MTIMSQLSPVQTIGEAHLQIVSAVRAAAHGEEDGRPACRRRGLQGQPLREGATKEHHIPERKSTEVIIRTITA